MGRRKCAGNGRNGEQNYQAYLSCVGGFVAGIGVCFIVAGGLKKLKRFVESVSGLQF